MIEFSLAQANRKYAIQAPRGTAQFRSHYDPAALLCKNRVSASCLTAADLKTLKIVFGGTRFSKYFFSPQNKPHSPILAPRAPSLFCRPERQSEMRRRSRTNEPPTRFRLHISGMPSPTPLLATNLSGKPETRFRKAPHGPAKTPRRALTGLRVLCAGNSLQAVFAPGPLLAGAHEIS